MKVIPTPLQGLLIFEPEVFHDSRGFFQESFNQQRFQAATGLHRDFVQDNHSRSTQGVLRGLHYQVGQPQGKLVRVARGRAFDVAVDMRQGSPTLGHWFGLELSEANALQMWVPEGFAHGFLALSPEVDLLYKTTAFYAPAAERSILWSDPDLAIAWPLALAAVPDPNLSPKDAAAGKFVHAEKCNWVSK